MVANIVILHKFNNFTGYGEALCALMMMAYYTIYFMENLLSVFPQVHLIFNNTFTSPTVWLSILMVCLQVSIFEMLADRMKLLSDQNEIGDYLDYEDDPEYTNLINIKMNQNINQAGSEPPYSINELVPINQ